MGRSRYWLVPLAAMGVAGVWFSGLGIVRAGWVDGHPEWMGLAAGASLEVSWIGAACSGRAGLLGVFGWALSFWLAIHGGGVPGGLAQVIALLQARTLGPAETLAERLARWRRAREAISVQLEMSQGVVPWIGRAARQFWSGRAPGRTVDATRMVAEMEDAEIMARALPPGPGGKRR